MLNYWVLHQIHFLFVHLCAMILIVNSWVLHLLLLLFLYLHVLILKLNSGCCTYFSCYSFTSSDSTAHCLSVSLLICSLAWDDPRVPSEWYTCFSSDLLTCMRWSWGSLWVIHLLLFWFTHLHEMILGLPPSDTPASLLNCSLAWDDPRVSSECYTCFSVRRLYWFHCVTNSGWQTVGRELYRPGIRAVSNTRQRSNRLCEYSIIRQSIMYFLQVFGHQVICRSIILTLWPVYTNWDRNSMTNFSILWIASD